MISVEEALNRLFALVSPLGHEEVPLSQAAGRVMVEDVVARRTQPPFAASAMDGYAVRAADAKLNAVLTVIGAGTASTLHRIKFALFVPNETCIREVTGLGERENILS